MSNHAIAVLDRPTWPVVGTMGGKDGFDDLAGGKQERHVEPSVEAIGDGGDTGIIKPNEGRPDDLTIKRVYPSQDMGELRWRFKLNPGVATEREQNNASDNKGIELRVWRLWPVERLSCVFDPDGSK